MNLTNIITVIVTYALTALIDWKIFEKAGEAGWKALIPVYNVYVSFKIFWDTKIFWTALILAIVVEAISMLHGFDAVTVIDYILLLVAFVASVSLFLISLLYINRVSKSFGHGIGFTIGLILLPVIFELILAFNSDKYKKIK